MSCRGYNCARARRSARRQQLQAEYRLNSALKAAVSGGLCGKKQEAGYGVTTETGSIADKGRELPRH